MKEVSENKRLFGLDLLRILSIVIVVSVHFFHNTEFYYNSITGLSMRIQLGIRNFCMSCVPLFIMITGFLNNKKDYNKKFFKGLLNILIIWLFYSVIELIILGIKDGNLFALDLKAVIYKISSFNACNYSWYIEMFFGLYLMTPILNRAYESFDDKSKKIVTALSILLTIIPIFTNEMFDSIFHIPSYWTGIYIIAYYFCGKSIAFFNPKYNKLNLIMLIVLVCIIGLFPLNNKMPEYESLLIFIQSNLLFLLLYNVNINNKIVRKIANFFSNISLDIYLASSLIDVFVYEYLYKFVTNSSQQIIIIYFPITVFASFFISSLYACVRKLLVRIR